MRLKNKVPKDFYDDLMDKYEKCLKRVWQLEAECDELKQNLDQWSEWYNSLEEQVMEEEPNENGPLKVTIHWDKIGKKGANEIINERTGSGTFVKVLERLSDKLGSEILYKLCSLRVSRGYLVTKNPEPRYHLGKLNGYFILTTTETPEKKTNLEKALEHLALPQALLSIELK